MRNGKRNLFRRRKLLKGGKASVVQISRGGFQGQK